MHGLFDSSQHTLKKLTRNEMKQLTCKSQARTVFAQTLQVPSLLTMQAPTGFSGVQAFINIGHSFGLIFPIMTRWHSQPRSMSLPCSTFTPCLTRESYSSNSSRNLNAESGKRPIPRQFPPVTANALAIISNARGFPSGFTMREYSFSNRAVPSFRCFRSMYIPINTSIGSKPATTVGMR